MKSWLVGIVQILVQICYTSQSVRNGCGQPQRRNNEELAFPSRKYSYSHGDEVVYNCRPGYIKLGQIRFRCNQGEWEQTMPPHVKCRNKPCGQPGDTPFGSFELFIEDEFVFGARVVYWCDEGYEMIGKTNYRECRVDGWSNDVPRCEIRRCRPLKAPEHGRIIMAGIQKEDPEFVYGQVVLFECLGSFEILGSEYIICTAEGEWSASVPTCTAMQCEAPILENGHVRPRKHQYLNAESVYFLCRPGFVKVGPNFARCYNAAWSSPPPICKEITTCDNTAPLNGFVTEQKDQFALNERTIYGCRNGFTTPQGLKREEIQCLAEGWMPKPECVVIECSMPILEHGTVQPRKDQYLHKEMVQYSCIRGYTKVGPDLSQCQHQGWSPMPPTCKSKQCEAPILENGHVQPRKDQYWNAESVHFLCRPGFIKVGPDFARCYNSAWSSPPPICKATHCESLFLDHGDIQPRKDHYLQGDVIQFSCHSEFTRVGPASSQCYHFGWSPSPPTCKGQVNNCNTPLPNISNGGIIGDLYEEYEHEEQVEYKCDVKYALTGAKLITCIDGKWTSSPTCTVEEKTCGLPPSIASGHVIGVVDREHYFHGETVRYRCEENFVITATNPAVCIHGEWELPFCADDSTKCAHPSPPRNANFVSAVPLKSQYNTNDILSYSCDSRIYQTKCVNGEWLPKPDCRELCPPPPQLLNAIDITEPRNYDSGDRIHFRCQENFELQGPREILCKEDGKWQTPPHCVGTIS